MRDDTLFALLTAIGVGVIGTAWYLWLESRQTKKQATVDLVIDEYVTVRREMQS